MAVNQIKENISVVDVLDKYLGVKLPMRGSKSKNIPCPIHGGHNDNFAVDTGKNIATCFSKCNKTWNVIDLVMVIHNIDFKGAISLLEKDFNISSVKGSKPQRKALVSVGEPTNAVKNYAKLYNTLSQNDYFLKRGLSQEIIDKYQLGYIDQDTDLSCIENERDRKLLKTYYNFIIPISERFFIARVNDEKVETETRYRNFGEADILNKQYIGDASKRFIFVVEGAIDALTIETLGHHAIALNSASNHSKLIKEIQSNEEKAREQQFILLADNDTAGKTLEEKLQDSFKKMNMSIHVGKVDERYKDINELSINYPDHAADLLDTSIDDCINSNSAFNILIDFFTDMKKVTPIQLKFPKLNDVIGGLRTGFYVVGAASSLGKTTFVQQIADDVASQRRHVLFFSLEMGKKELIAKSLVRTMGELKEKKKVTGEITFTRDLLNGDIKNHDILHKAIGEYSSTSKNMFIHEGMFDMNVYVIRQEIEKHIRLHNLQDNKPLIIVDYLQILQPVNDRLSEKQATDKNVTELKRITRDLDVPLIAISSFNRDGYNKEASFSSFKESGAIEYGSDVVLALELLEIKESGADATGKVKDIEKLNKAKGSLNRQINLKVLKNRFGKAFEEIEFEYNTVMNKYTEVATRDNASHKPVNRI